MSSPLTCASLPSSNSALAVVNKEPGAWLRVARDAVLRSVLIGTGMATYDLATRGRVSKKIAQRALAGSLAIEVFVLSYTAWRARQAQTTAQAPSASTTST